MLSPCGGHPGLGGPLGPDVQIEATSVLPERLSSLSSHAVTDDPGALSSPRKASASSTAWVGPSVPKLDRELFPVRPQPTRPSRPSEASMSISARLASLHLGRPLEAAEPAMDVGMPPPGRFAAGPPQIGRFNAYPFGPGLPPCSPKARGGQPRQSGPEVPSQSATDSSDAFAAGPPRLCRPQLCASRGQESLCAGASPRTGSPAEPLGLGAAAGPPQLGSFGAQSVASPAMATSPQSGIRSTTTRFTPPVDEPGVGFSGESAGPPRLGSFGQRTPARAPVGSPARFNPPADTDETGLGLADYGTKACQAQDEGSPSICEGSPAPLNPPADTDEPGLGLPP